MGFSISSGSIAAFGRNHGRPAQSPRSVRSPGPSRGASESNVQPVGTRTSDRVDGQASAVDVEAQKVLVRLVGATRVQLIAVDAEVVGDPQVHRDHQRTQEGTDDAAQDGTHPGVAGGHPITGTKIRPVLQAAHVRPLPAGGEHRLDNGLLLRSDVHTLLDRGYLAVDPRHRLLVSPRLREEFGNGEQFYARAGQQITLPRRVADRPARAALEWHLDEVFQRS